MSVEAYNLITIAGCVPVKAWTKGVLLDERAKEQLLNVAKLPLIFRWIGSSA